MEQPIENKNANNMNTMPENQQVRKYKEIMRMILEIASDHCDETYPRVEKVIEECSKKM